MAMVEFSPEQPRVQPLPDAELHEYAGLFIPKVETLLNNTHRVITGITQDQGTKIERFSDREGKRVGELIYTYNPHSHLWECREASYFAGWNNDDPRGPRACTFRARREERIEQLPNGAAQTVFTGQLDYRPSGDQHHFNTPHAAQQINNALTTSLRAFGLQ